MNKKLTLKYNNLVLKSFIPSFFLVLFILVLLPAPAMSQSWYIKPSAEIPLRRGQGSEYKILAILPDGVQVTIIEEDDPWVKISTDDGKEGWLLKRYLSQEQPLHELVDALQSENDILKLEAEELQQKYTELSDLHAQSQQELGARQKELTENMTAYQKLKEDTANVVRIRNDLTQSKQTISTLQQELDSISSRYNQLKASRNIQWFLAGGGTLIFGCLIGMIFAKSKKRKPSLY